MRPWLVALALLLAGCAETDPADGDQLPDGTGGDNDAVDPGFAPQEEHDEATDPGAPGLVLEGDMFPCDEGFCIDAEARNEGDEAYHVSSICVSPWSERMERDGQAVAHRQPMAHCLAFGTAPFEPLDTLRTDFSWSATVWDAEEERFQPAPGGAYQWIVTFRAYDEDDGAGAHDLETTFTVVVGET